MRRRVRYQYLYEGTLQSVASPVFKPSMTSVHRQVHVHADYWLGMTASFDKIRTATCHYRTGCILVLIQILLDSIGLLFMLTCPRYGLLASILSSRK